MIFTNYAFEKPIFFYLALFMAIIITVKSFLVPDRKIVKLFSNEKRKLFIASDLILILLCFLQFTGLAIISFASGNPVDTKPLSQKNRKIRDIYFVVDVSRSMLADDFIPDRLGVAKKYIREFVKLRSADRIGLNIFAEKVITLSPLTLDHQALLDKVNDISVGFLGNGTNIGDAVALGVSRLEKLKSKSKIIILLTDGVSNAGSISSMHAGEIAKEKGVKVYAIGIGTEGDAFLPYKVGNRIMKQRIPGGNIDHDSLERISKMTNGKYYRATSEKSLERIFFDINKLERTNVLIKDQKLINFRYKEYLIIGSFLFLIAELLRRYFFRFAE